MKTNCGTQGVHMMGCAYLNVVHVVLLLRVCTQFYDVYELYNIRAIC